MYFPHLTSASQRTNFTLVYLLTITSIFCRRILGSLYKLPYPPLPTFTVTEESGRVAVIARRLSVARLGVYRVVWCNIL